MLLSHRAARTHLDAPRCSKYFLRRRSAGSVFTWILADRFAWFGYGPVVRRKPFGPHLTVGALSCLVGLLVISVHLNADDHP
jgi:hypothetical protein